MKFENLNKKVKKAEEPKRKHVPGKDSRSLTQKAQDGLKVLIVVYLVVIHFLAALYLTNNKLILRVENGQFGQALVSPLSK